jgi:hypothetical protein
MKTNKNHSKKNIPISLFGLLSLFLVSCGSYQNSSYYDSDGIYVDRTSTPQNNVATGDTGNSQAYQNFFKSKQLNVEEEVFTDVENYSSVERYDSISNKTNASWGSNPSSVTVNVYGANSIKLNLVLLSSYKLCCVYTIVCLTTLVSKIKVKLCFRFNVVFSQIEYEDSN